MRQMEPRPPGRANVMTGNEHGGHVPAIRRLIYATHEDRGTGVPLLHPDRTLLVGSRARLATIADRVP